MLATGLNSLDTIRREHQLILDGPVVAAFKSFIQRRAAHEPLQHIEGITEFYGLTYKTDNRALIPRADSEELVSQVLARLSPDSTGRIADLGTGTGCLLLSVLHERPGMSGTGVEASQDAATLARENTTRLGLEGRAEIFGGSWQDWTGWGDVDLILSNPPYIDRATLETLAPEVRDHDPLMALDGGVDGLDSYRDIIARSAAAMKPGAWLCLEIGFDQGDSVPALIDAGGFQEISAYKDLGSRDRVVCARKPA